MDNTPEKEIPGTDNPLREEGYIPRPAWQVWAARIGLVVFIAVLVLYYCRMLGVGF